MVEKQKKLIKVDWKNIREIAEKLSLIPLEMLGNKTVFKLEKLGYFSLSFCDSQGVSWAYFSPIIHRDLGETKGIIGNYFTFLKLLIFILTHPDVSEVYYDPEDNKIVVMYDLRPEYEEIIYGDEDEDF